MKDHATRAVHRRRKTAEKPAMPENLQPHVERARTRHARRHANPGVEVEVEKVTGAYVLSSPHSDRAAWEVMVSDALGTRSKATAMVFLTQLTELCSKAWQPDEDGTGGSWYPDPDELNAILNFVAGVKPRNEMEAALAAQMVAVHMMTMSVTERCLRVYGCADPHLAAAASKLARTFAMQTEALSKLRGRKTTRQKITVSYEKHEHQHVHVHRGEEEIGGQPHAKQADAPVAPLLGNDTPSEVLPLASSERKAGMPNARRQKLRGAQGTR